MLQNWWFVIYAVLETINANYTFNFLKQSIWGINWVLSTFKFLSSVCAFEFWQLIFSEIITQNNLNLQFSCSVLCDSLWPHGMQLARLPCSSQNPRDCSNSCALNQWCHPTISSSIIPFSSCPQSYSASGSFPMSQFITSGGQSVGDSASVLPMNIQDWFPLGLTGLISLQSKGLSRVFSNTTVQNHQFFGTHLSNFPNIISVCDYWKNHSFDYTDLW